MSLRVCIFQSDKPRERFLTEAMRAGIKAHGDDAEVRPLTGQAQTAEGCDVATMVGVKSKRLFEANWPKGIHTVMLDKGYIRENSAGEVKGWKYWRASIDGHHPTQYLKDMKCPSDRWDRLDIRMKPWRKSGRHVIFAGSSEKYHEFYGMENPTEYASKYVWRINKASGRPIIYRPKPSWLDARPIDGTTFSYGKGTTIYDLFPNAHCLVTHGSNACFEAVCEGVPCVVLGDAVAKPISSIEAEDVENPRLATDEERLQWASNLAYCQWSLAEWESGEAWAFIRKQIITHCA